MPRTLLQRAPVLLAAICLAASVPSTSFAQQTQGQQQTADRQKKKSGGSPSAKATTKTPPAPAKDADNLKPERMSTRGLHKGGNDASNKSGKQGGESGKKSGSAAKQDSQK